MNFDLQFSYDDFVNSALPPTESRGSRAAPRASKESVRLLLWHKQNLSPQANITAATDNMAMPIREIKMYLWYFFC